MTVREALRRAAALLADARVPDARLDAEYLLAELLGTDRLRLLADGDTPLVPECEKAYDAWLARRARREPLQYILGTQPFMGLTLRVTPDALIPRADTETLCEEAYRRMRPGMRCLDLCTGTGALAIAMKAHCPGAEVYASDISKQALSLAEANAKRLGTEIHFCQGDLFAPLGEMDFGLIVSNPPYIPSGELPGLQAEVRFEPALALDGGRDGLDFYRRIAGGAPARLSPGGALLMEIGSTQAEPVTGLLERAGLTEIRVLKDLAGLDRVVCAVRQ